MDDSPSPTPKKKHPPSEAAVQLADHLFTTIHDRNPSFSPLGRSAWASDIDKMIRLDGRDPDDIGRVIDWCQADEFWQNNILSGAKLRKQFDQLAMKMEKAGGLNGWGMETRERKAQTHGVVFGARAVRRGPLCRSLLLAREIVLAGLGECENNNGGDVVLGFLAR